MRRDTLSGACCACQLETQVDGVLACRACTRERSLSGGRGFQVEEAETRNALWRETIQSLYYMWQLTDVVLRLVYSFLSVSHAFEFPLCLHAGLAPEKIYFLEDGGFRVEEVDTGNVLRPETVESLYYMWRLTGEQRYREWGWEIFQAFQDHAKGEAGYHSLLVRDLSSLDAYKSPSSGAYRT